jgi:hypothetical protein
MDWQVVEIINKLVEAATKTCHGSFRLHIDKESTEAARTICDTDPQAKNKRRALRGY